MDGISSGARRLRLDSKQCPSCARTPTHGMELHAVLAVRAERSSEKILTFCQVDNLSFANYPESQ